MNVPALSVVIPSVNGLHDLLGCLQALEQQVGAPIEVIVIDRVGASLRDVVRQQFPHVLVVSVPADTTIPMMRAAAFRQATAEAVAVIEDHVIVPPDWAAKLLAGLRSGNEVVGGPIDNLATDDLVEWASFLCEYSACLPPLPAGEATWLPGNNIGYRKEILLRFADVFDEGKWENHLHDAMRAGGVKLICLPDLVVGHKKHFSFLEYLSQRYLYARSYAGMRVIDRGIGGRVLYGLGAFALPPVLFVRTVRAIVSKGRHLQHLWPSLPLIGVFVLSWTLGEVIGYWLGAGKSLSRVR